MVFDYSYISFDRFFLSIVMHPNDDASIEFALLILHTLITQSRNFNQHIQYLVHFLPSHYTASTNNSQDFFKSMGECYTKFPEYTYEEHYTKILFGNSHPNHSPYANAENHLPIYYGTLVERILPVVDNLLIRALELQVNDRILSSFLKTFSPLYKFHRKGKRKGGHVIF